MSSQTPGLEVLGSLVEQYRPFKLKIPNHGICRPIYIWDDDEIDATTIVGCLSIMDGKTILSLSQVDTIWYQSGKLTRIATVPILHSGDTRDVDKMNMFDLPIGSIACLFQEIKR
jgi:hypothetical protein